MTAIPTIWHPLPMTDMLVRQTEAGGKTETRRIVRRLAGVGPVTEVQRSLTPGYDWTLRDRGMRCHDLTHAEMLACCPYGAPGHRLWVRQAWTGLFGDPPSYWQTTPRSARTAANCRALFFRSDGFTDSARWVPGMFMPRWASRLHLRLTSINIERLQNITDERIRAEGVADLLVSDLIQMAGSQNVLESILDGGGAIPWPGRDGSIAHCFDGTLRAAFACTWNLITGHRPGCRWEDDPWVWVIQYERSTHGCDDGPRPMRTLHPPGSEHQDGEGVAGAGRKGAGARSRPEG